MRIPCLTSDFSSAMETSVSSTGRMLGIISTMVTLVPKALKK
jgi:hypothetical protein